MIVGVPAGSAAARRRAAGFTLIELLVVIAIIGIIAAVAVPGLLRARMAANEASAIASLRAINLAQHTYTQRCLGFATDLPELQNAGGYLSPDLTGAAVVTKSGYTVTLAASAAGVPIAAPPAGCTAPVSDYFAHAEPLSIGSTGARSFATTKQGTIYQQSTGAPIADPVVVGGTISVLQ